MKYVNILAITMFFLIFINPFSPLFSQERTVVKGQTEFNNYFISEIRKVEDSIKAKVKSAGVIHVRFTLSKEGVVNDSIRFSKLLPVYLVKVIGDIMRKIKFDTDGKNYENTYFILPVEYSYVPDLKPNMNAYDLMNRVEDLDLGNWQYYLNYDYSSFYRGDGEEEKKLWGLNCIFLPTIGIYPTFKSEYRVN